MTNSNVRLPANVALVDCIPEPFDPIDEMQKFPIALGIALHVIYINRPLVTKYINGFNTESYCICKAMGYELYGAMHRLLHAICEYGETSCDWVNTAALDLSKATKEELATANYYLDAYFHEITMYQKY